MIANFVNFGLFGNAKSTNEISGYVSFLGYHDVDFSKEWIKRNEFYYGNTSVPPKLSLLAD